MRKPLKDVDVVVLLPSGFAPELQPPYGPGKALDLFKQPLRQAFRPQVCAVQTLVSWCEYPYRIRRRTSDDPDTLTKLADLGHDLQEHLARQRAWIAADSRFLSEAYDAAIARVAQQVRAACQDAWTQPPIEQPAQMNLGSFGPGDVGPVISALECAVSYRFGLRRLLPSRLLRKRLKARGCMP
jgi:hypothetical protein